MQHRCSQRWKIVFYYFQKAAEKGSEFGIVKMAKKFRDGKGIEKSEEHFKKYNSYSLWLEKEQAEVEFDKSDQEIA